MSKNNLLDSAYAIVRVYMPDGEVVICHVPPWVPVSLGGTTVLGITCKP